jgi:hypothetical protein
MTQNGTKREKMEPTFSNVIQDRTDPTPQFQRV